MILLSPKSLSFLIIAVILTAIFSNLSITWADEEAYDEAEAIRRAAETLYNIDKQQKEAARRRWDEKHTSTSGDWGSIGKMAIWVIVIIAVAVWSSIKATQAQAKEFHRQEVRQMERHKAKAQFEERVSTTFSRFKKKNEPESGDKQ